MLSYKDYIAGGGVPLYPTKYTGRADGLFKVRCPCGSLAFPQTMVDVRSFDAVLTEGQEFACDGCISDWERNKKPLKAGDIFLVRHEFRAAFAAHRLGAADQQADAVALEYLNKELKRTKDKEKAYAEAPADDSEKIKLEDRRKALETRITERTI